MADNEMTVWRILAGKAGEAERLFLEHNCIALGWPQMGDLSQLKPDQEDFKNKVAESYPEAKAGAIPNWAGLLFRFVYTMKVGDIVVYPSKRDRHIHIGRVAGDYNYDRKLDPRYPNQRPVTWISSVPRIHFTQGALYELGARGALFQVKNYANEFIDVLEGKIPPKPPGPLVTIPIDEIQQSTRDFILDQLEQELKGHPLEDFVAHLLETMGYRTRISPKGPDGGIDMLAHRDELGFEPPIIKVQVKSSGGKVGEPDVAALAGKVTVDGEYGLFVTLGTFTPQAKIFARNQGLRLIDGDDLVELVLQHYEKFDSPHKGLLPLKRVYVPEALEEEAEE